MQQSCIPQGSLGLQFVRAADGLFEDFGYEVITIAPEESGPLLGDVAVHALEAGFVAQDERAQVGDAALAFGHCFLAALPQGVGEAGGFHGLARPPGRSVCAPDRVPG